MKPQLLDDMVTRELVAQKAKELNITLDDKTLSDDAQKQLDDFMKSLPDQEKFKKKLEDKKLTMDDLKNMFKSYQAQNKVYENVSKDITVSDEDAKKYYNDNIYQYTEKPNVMNVSHILVKTQKEAQDIKDKLDKGAKFEDLAKQFGTDGTKDNGGSLGDINYTALYDGSYDKDFMVAAVALPEGKISGPVQTQFGFHIIKVNKKTEYPTKSFDTVKEDVKKTLLQSKKSEKIQSTLTDWEGKAKITKYTDKL
jgi:foldase protein PrsA